MICIGDKKNLTSKVSRRGQTTIPASVRVLLHIKPGNPIKYEIEYDIVCIRKTDGIDLEWTKAIENTLTELSGPEDYHL